MLADVARAGGAQSSTGVVQSDETLRTAAQALPALEKSVSAARANCEQANARFRAALVGKRRDALFFAGVE